MECTSISHKTAASGEREKFFIPKDKKDDFLREIRAVPGVEQCILLSTCNRTEIYVQGEENLFRGLEEVLSKTSGIAGERIRKLVRRYQGRKALQHLFRVVCGMESMVIGEDEILGQVRDAYGYSKEAGYTGYELNSVFQAALACAKRVKTETMISKTAVSVATLAVNEVIRMPLEHKTVLLLGSSGRMGSIILKNLLSQKNVRIIATVRSHNEICQGGNMRVEKVENQNRCASLEKVDYQNRYASLDEADAIISATSSPHYTLTAGHVREALRTPKDRLFLDISMPPDLDAEIGEMEHCRLVALDDIQKLAEYNNRIKQQSFADAEEIMDEELEKFCKVLAFHRFTESDVHWKERYARYSAQKLLYLLRDELDSGSFESVLRVLADANTL